MIVFRDAISPVAGLAVASSVPETLIPITRTTKNATIPTSARVQVDAIDLSSVPAVRTALVGGAPPLEPSVLRRAGGRQTPDALHEAAQELVGVGVGRDIDVRRASPDASPVRDGLAGGQPPGKLDVDGDGLRRHERPVEGGGDRQRVVDERAVEPVVVAVELHVEPQRVGDVADDRVARYRARRKHRALAASEGDGVIRGAAG